MTTVGDVLGSGLRSMGVRRVYGDTPLPGLPHTPIADGARARLLADADGRALGGVGAALVGGGTRLRLSSAPGQVVEAVDADHPAQAVGWTGLLVPAARELVLTFDLDVDADDTVLPALALTLGSRALPPLPPRARVVVVAGPGLARSDHVGSLRDLTAATGWGVVNTWGAKGLFRWDDPRHLGTAGLQARDFELAGLVDADVVVGVGLDRCEGPHDDAGFEVIELRPWDLPRSAAVAVASGHGVAASGGEQVPARPRLYTELASALASLYASAASPLTPARAASDLAAVLPPGGLVVADPGPAGLWVGRAFPTVELNSAIVPATRAPGFAVAAAFAAGLAHRPAVAVTTAPLGDESLDIIELARRRSVPMTVAVWGGEDDLGEPVASPDEHQRRVRAALESPGVDLVAVPVDLSLTRVLVEVAGPVVAWQS